MFLKFVCILFLSNDEQSVATRNQENERRQDPLSSTIHFFIHEDHDQNYLREIICLSNRKAESTLSHGSKNLSSGGGCWWWLKLKILQN